MENTVYIVSFGDSRHYILNVTEGNNREVLAQYEKELNDYLGEKFPGQTFAYYTTPRITPATQADLSAGYPELTPEALPRLKAEALREVQVMNAEKSLDCDAPWSEIK